MVPLLLSLRTAEFLKELRNSIFHIILAWSLFCSIRVYAGLHFLSVFFVKLVFRCSVFSVFFVLCFEFNIIFKGATKLYYMHYSRVVIILFSKGLCKSAFSILLVKLGFRHSGFWFFVFFVLVFRFSILHFEFNIISKNLITFV